MEFKKYLSIENSYRSNFIEKWVSAFPELLLEKFIATEKIHGSNFSIMITKDSIEYGKRTSKLEIDESFFDWQNTVLKYKAEFELVQSYIKKHDIDSVRFFGELFGNGVQKGVYYSDEKEIRLFDGYINDVLLPQSEFIELLDIIGILHMFVPIIGIYEDLKTALEVDTKFDSKLTDRKDNICEGVVIKPYDKVYEFNNGGFFYLKKKNAEFSEKQKAKKVVTNFEPSENYQEELNAFVSYLTENRLNNVFSKNGRIEEPKQIGEYIGLMLKDAKEEYLKDNMEGFMTLNDKERKKLFGITSTIVVPLLKQYL